MRKFTVFCSLIVLFAVEPLMGKSYYNIYNQSFLSLGLQYQRMTREVNLEFRPVNAGTSLPFREDNQKFNQDRFTVVGKIHFIEELAAILEAGVIDLEGKDYNFGALGTLNFKAKKRFTWGVGLAGDIYRFPNTMLLSAEAIIRGWKLDVQNGEVDNITYSGWLTLSREYSFGGYGYSPNNDYYWRPYLSLGGSWDDIDAALSTSAAVGITTPGKNKDKESIRAGIDWRLGTFNILLEGRFIDENSFRFLISL